MNIRLTKIKLPHTIALIFIIMVFVAILTWIIPGGQYQRIENAQGRELVVAGTYQPAFSRPQGIAAILKAPIAGISQTASIIGRQCYLFFGFD